MPACYIASVVSDSLRQMLYERLLGSKMDGACFRNGVFIFLNIFFNCT